MTILQEYFSATRSLHQGEIDWLLGHGVPPLAMARDGHELGYAIGAAKVVFSDAYFDFAQDEDDDALTALCVVARAEDSRPADIIAWCPRDQRMAPHLGTVSMIGEQWVVRARVGEPLRVHRDLLGWLKADREGVVVLNHQRALPALSYAGTLQAEDVDHGLSLRNALRPPELNIVIPKISNTSVAA